MHEYRYSGENPRVLFHKLRLPGEVVTCSETQAAQVNEEAPGTLVPAGEEAEGRAEMLEQLAEIQERLESRLAEPPVEPVPDPTEMTVAEIKVLDLDPDQWATLLALEREGKARVTVIEYAWAMAFGEDE